MKSYEELLTLYESKCEECNLAGTIGQMLLQENEELKTQLASLENSIAPAAEQAIDPDASYSSEQYDPGLLNEIQQSLVQQSRQLKLQLEEEYQARLELESSQRENERIIDGLTQKNIALKKKVELIDEQKYKAQQQVSHLESQVSELSGTIVKLKMENIQKRNEIDRITAELESNAEENLSFYRDTGSLRSLQLSSENRSIASMDELPVSPIRQKPPMSPIKPVEHSFFSSSAQGIENVLFSECSDCAQVKNDYSELAREKQELEMLLDKSYEAFERLQNESMLSGGQMSFEESLIQQELKEVKGELERVVNERQELQELLSQSQEAYERIQNESMLSTTNYAEILQEEVGQLKEKLKETLTEKNRLQEMLKGLEEKKVVHDTPVTSILPAVQDTPANIATSFLPEMMSINYQQVNDVQAHAMQAKELLEGTRTEILEAQQSITTAISDLVSQYQNAINTSTPLKSPTPRKRMKETRTFSNDALIEVYESRNQSVMLRRRPFTTPVLGTSPSNSSLSITEDIDTPKGAKPKRILKELRSLQMPSATKRAESIKAQTPVIESLTYTMIGSYFLKYNRFQKNPQLRYCWVNPYSRTLHWGLQPTTDSSSGKTKSAYIVALQWRDTPGVPTNIPPTEMNSIIIATPYRLMKLQPISWEIHDHWVKGLGLLLKRTKNTYSIKDQYKMMQEYQNDSEEDVKTPKANANVEVLTGSDATMKHRRVHTMISTTASQSATPKKLKEHHRRLTLKTESKNDGENPFLNSASSIATLTPRKFSLFRK